jgi:hypothetical protein
LCGPVFGPLLDATSGYVVLGIGAVAALGLSRWCDLAAVEARRSPVGASATVTTAR